MEIIVGIIIFCALVAAGVQYRKNERSKLNPLRPEDLPPEERESGGRK